MKAAHDIRGVAWYLSSTSHRAAPIDVTSHLKATFLGLDFAWCSRYLSGGYTPPPPAAEIFRLAADYFIRPASNFDAWYVTLAMQGLSQEGCSRFLVAVRQQLEVTRIDSPTPFTYQERAQIMQLSDKIPADVMSKLSMNLASLEQALLAKDPLMPQHLRSSHQLLISYPETVHLLDDSEVATLIAAAEQHTKTQIIKDTVKKSAGTSKKLSVTDL